MENNNQTATANVENKISLTVQEPLEFDGSLKTKIISTMELCEVISSLFEPSLFEYCGCKIELNVGKALPEVANSFAYGAPYVDIYLKYKGETETEKVRMLESRVPVNNNNNNDGKPSLAERFARVNRTFASTSLFTVTKDAHDVLSDLMPKGKRTNWNAITEEITNPMNVYGKEETLVRISGLDLTKIVSEIYGAEGSKYEYIIEPRTPIPSQTNEFIIQIIQYDTATTNKVQAMLGNFRVTPVNFHRVDV